MDSITSFFARVLDALSDDRYWQTAPVHVPASVEATTVAAAILVSVLAIAGGLVWLIGLPRRLTFVPFKAKPWPISVREHAITHERDDWNVVSIWQEEMKAGHNFQVDKNEQYQAAVLTIRHKGRLQTASVRLSVERGLSKTPIVMHERLAKRLGLVSADTDLNIPKGEFVALDQCEVDIRNPVSFNPVQLLTHPDPDVRLQWRITAISLVAGILFPKVLGW